MNSVIRLMFGQPQARELFASASQFIIELGMPHLNAFGLPETRLLWSLGHRHLPLIAPGSGLGLTRFGGHPDGLPR